jgi:hypothetical protein
MKADHENLTPGERRFLERQQEADSEGVSLPDYYRSHGLSLQALYSVQRTLVSKGRAAARSRRTPSAHPYWVSWPIRGGASGNAVPGRAWEGLPAQIAERLAHRVRRLAGPLLVGCPDEDEATMRPVGEGLRIYLHRAPADMRKYALSAVMRTQRCELSWPQQCVRSARRIVRCPTDRFEHSNELIWGLESSRRQGGRYPGSERLKLFRGSSSQIQHQRGA